MGADSSIKILVFHYKNGAPFPALSCYEHIWAGKNGKSEATLLTGDDEGENISAKNKHFSELTGLYWFWKNRQATVVGTCHYRRFFTAQPIPLLHRVKQILYYPIGLKRKRNGLIYCSDSAFWEKRILNCAEIESLLSRYDVLLPQPRTLKYTVEKHFSRYHQHSDLLLLQQIIEELSPEFSTAFQNMLQQKKLYANNMFVIKEAHFEQLANWLFSILFEFEKRVDLKNYTNYQERLFGFLSERLITTWFFQHSALKIKELPLIYLKHFKKR